MKGLVLSAAALVLLVLGSAVALRFYRGNKEFRVFLGAFAAAVVLYTGTFWLLPPDLGFLPAGWRETVAWVDFGNGLLLLVLMFHGYWCFSYFACLSPSMSVMVSLRLRGREGMSRAEVLGDSGQRSAGQPHLPAPAARSSCRAATCGRRQARTGSSRRVSGSPRWDPSSSA